MLITAKKLEDTEVLARDGAIGKVADIYFDDQTWHVRYLVVDTSWTVRYFLIDTKNWLPGKKVIVPPQAIRKVSWLESSVMVDLTREAIESGPEIDESRPLTADYTDRLDAHYRRYKSPASDVGNPSWRRKAD